MPPLPKVSVIIAAYNAETYILRTLASVRAQTYPNLEIVVVDDGSQDRTADVVDSIADSDEVVTLHRQANKGVAAARNLAIAKSYGEYIAPIDADDVWHPRKIERQVACMLASGPSTGLVYAWSINLDGRGNFLNTYPKWKFKGAIYEPLLKINFIGNASVPLIPRMCIEQVGGYDCGLKVRGGQGCEDWDLSLRIADRYAFDVVPAYLIGYRNAPSSMSRNFDAMATSYELMVEAVKGNRPDIAAWTYLTSRVNFYLYLAEICRRNGDYRKTMTWIRKALSPIPLGLLSPMTATLILKKLQQVTAGRLLSMCGTDYPAWLQFKAQLGIGHPADNLLAELIRVSAMRRSL